MRCGAVILAAGASSRFGSPKQLAEIDGKSLLQRAIRTCAETGLQPIVVVLGANVDVIRPHVDAVDIVLVVNELWQEGMGSSLRKGIDAIQQSDVDAVVVLTCDMPFLGSVHLCALVGRAERTRRSVASSYDDHRGVPACFVRDDFANLLQSKGDSGARALLKDAPCVELVDASDIDTPDQLLVARTMLGAKN